MKQVVDKTGNVVRGVYRKPDGSLVVKDDILLNKSKKQKEFITTMSQEISDLKSQMAKILEALNGKS